MAFPVLLQNELKVPVEFLATHQQTNRLASSLGAIRSPLNALVQLPVLLDDKARWVINVRYTNQLKTAVVAKLNLPGYG